MNFKDAVIIVAIFLSSLSVNCFGNFVEDYCWRDYEGSVPTDALKGGTDRNGRPIYIGQVLYDNKLIPGKIHENVTEIHIEFKKAYTLTYAIKILCTQYPEKFEWFQTRYDNIWDIKNKHIFEGGYEKGFITYVGRGISHGELTVGKIICYDRGYEKNCYKLTTIENGKWHEHSEFEILTYNPEAVIKTTSTTPSSPASISTSRSRFSSKPSTESTSDVILEDAYSTITADSTDYVSEVYEELIFSTPRNFGCNSKTCSNILALFFYTIVLFAGCCR